MSSMDERAIVLAQPRLSRMIPEILRGKSIFRSIQNLMVEGMQLQGSVCDLGAKSSASSYYRFIDISKAKMVFCDLFPQSPDVIKVDLEEKLPFETGAFDFVLLMHVIDYIYNLDQLVREASRICRGSILLACPFSSPLCPDPVDYRRVTGAYLRRAFNEAGAADVQTVAWGKGPFTLALYNLERLIPFRWLVAFLLVFAWSLDSIAAWLMPVRARERGAMGHLCLVRMRAGKA